MSQAAYIEDMANFAADPDGGPSEVAKFYAGSNVLLTGASGFLGKLTIEKILRSCPDVKTVYLLIRAKKGKTPEERFNEMFEDVVFDRLKRECPRFARKIVMVHGDMAEVDLGLSPEDRALLKTTHIVIHGAATVRFDEKLRIAININVRGTKELLLFAKEIPNLKAFVYISTAYSHCVSKVIDEVFYPPPMDSVKMMQLADILDEDLLDHLTPVLLGNWPNTYAFTKAVAEDTVRQYCTGIPLCIVRPSIVVATAKEPIAGWINNFYGPTGVVAGAGVGLLRVLLCNPDIVADIIPADYVINCIIVAAWDIAKTKSINANTAEGLTFPENDVPPIYNHVSSCQKPLTWSQFMKYNEECGKRIATTKAVWCYSLTLIKYYWMYKIYIFLLHLIPALIVDGVALATGRKPMLWKAYQKIHKFSAVIAYFSTQQWRFENHQVMELWNKIGPVDRSRFDFNVETIKWDEYFYHHMRGIRAYLIKDPLETVPEGLKRNRKFLIAHYTIITVFWGLIGWLVLTFLRFIGLW